MVEKGPNNGSYSAKAFCSLPDSLMVGGYDNRTGAGGNRPVPDMLYQGFAMNIE